MRTVKQVIDDIVQFGYGEAVLARRNALPSLISEFLHLCYTTENMKDDMNYPEPPEFPEKEIKKNIARNFPTFGSYESLTSKDGKGKKELRSAVNDLTAFAQALLQIKWHFEKSSKRYGAQCLKESFSKGLGLLAVELLSYLIYRELG